MQFDAHVSSELSDSGHASSSTSFIEFSNSASPMSSRICVPPKIPASNLSMVIMENRGTSK